ncbi:uncharacterized protein PV09_02384 [Verruconis gallopava]|uniref:Uncharacterized protein n=1 Tax=Verruconis gallopava TaxID=253628 RepID=A0A0D2B619_9PEZI|nr:uncharacterized protein PV09_02384 [Verruconis gallopava]KIW06679.1 hypothetical protein PV09_02384 [Verruconis gallopava]
MKITKDKERLPRCYFSYCALSNYKDQDRLPTKQQPFKAINHYTPAHTTDLMLPEELYALVEGKLFGKLFSYARVYMSLLDIVSGDFFNQYVKAGNVLMLSEGQQGVQNTFLLKDGILRLDVDKATYERCGLVGVAAPHPGRKHVKSRFRIDLDLKQASMQHGKKGFERIKWAFKTVLVESLAWLFVDLENEDVCSGPIAALHPQVVELRPTVTRLKHLVPPFVYDEEAIRDALYEEQLLEWLGMVMLESPRISQKDTIDSYLCKYTLPEEFVQTEESARQEQEVVHVRWHGFTSAAFLRHVWLTLRAATAEKSELWFSVGASTFDGTSFTLLCNDGRNVMLWECD